MKIEIQIGQTIIVDNFPATIIAVHPEIPSKITTIRFEFTEGPYKGIEKRIEVINN